MADRRFRRDLGPGWYWGSWELSNCKQGDDITVYNIIYNITLYVYIILTYILTIHVVSLSSYRISHTQKSGKLGLGFRYNPFPSHENRLHESSIGTWFQVGHLSAANVGANAPFGRPRVDETYVPEMIFLVGQMWYFCLVQVLLGHVFRKGSKVLTIHTIIVCCWKRKSPQLAPSGGKNTWQKNSERFKCQV